MKKILFILGIAFHFSSAAQVVINEFSASNLSGFPDDYAKFEDWVELHNTSSSSVNIGGWFLSDKTSKPGKWKIPSGTVIPGNGYLVFWCSGRDEASSGNYHTNFKLTQTKDNEVLLLADPDSNVIDMHDLGLALLEHSHCRSTDGSSTWMICTSPTPGMSNNGSSADQYQRYTERPSMSLAAGYYTSSQTVTITNEEPNSVLRFTTNGTNPTSASPVYSGPISINNTVVIKARAFSNNPSILPGKIEFNTYLMNESFTLPVFSVAADNVIDLANGNDIYHPIGSIEYFNLDREREATSFGMLDRHGQDSWALPHRSLDWISRDEMGYSKAVLAELFSHSDRDEYQKFMFRNSGDDNYPAINDGDHDGSAHIRDEYVQTLALEGDMKLDTRSVQRAILFLNGQYWGLYGMREKVVDHDFTDEYHDQDKYNLQYLATWDATDIEYGGIQALTDWITIREYILTNHFSDVSHFNHVDSIYNYLSLIDYMLVNMNVVAQDWLNYNTGWWRGLDPEGDHKKWGYILWDLDATFDYYINYTGIPNTSYTADPCDMDDISDYMDEFFGETLEPSQCPSILMGSSPHPADDPLFVQTIAIDPYCCDTEWDDICQEIYDDISMSPEEVYGNVGKHEKIFLKLIDESPEFQQLYYSRYADMMNTVFSCENMNSTFDRMIADIEPEMPRQIQRWGGSLSQWEDNVAELRTFINNRCSYLDDALMDCYTELSGPYEITLIAEPDGIGEIDFNTLDIEEFPWTGEYFGNMDNKIKARVFDEFTDEYVFSHWESKSGNVITPSEFDRRAFIRLTNRDTLVAHFQSLITSVESVEQYNLQVYPNPAVDQISLQYFLDKPADVQIELVSLLGQTVMTFEAEPNQSAGLQFQQLRLDRNRVAPGIYMLVLNIDSRQVSRKVNIANW